MTSAYDRLAELAEQGLDLARLGRWEDVDALGVEFGRITAGLPALPPAGARPALERAAAAQDQLAALATAGVADGRVELERRRRGRGAVRAYGQTSGGVDGRLAVDA